MRGAKKRAGLLPTCVLGILPRMTALSAPYVMTGAWARPAASSWKMYSGFALLAPWGSPTVSQIPKTCMHLLNCRAVSATMLLYPRVPSPL